MQKASKKNKITSYKSKKKFGYYLPIIFIIAIIPLIVRGKIIELPLEIANFWRGGTTQIDFFSYNKFIALIIGTIAFVCAYLGLFLNNKLPLQHEKKYYIPMLIYVALAIISAVMAKNKYVAIEGFIEMNQGIFVLLSYIILTFILMNYTRDERDVKIIVYSFVAVTVAEGLLGLGQYFGHDLFRTSLGQWLVLPASLKGKEIKFIFEAYTISGTLYNTNFVGSFAALVLPLSTVLYLYAKDKRKSIIFGITAVLAFVLWIGCNSRAGYLGIFPAFFLGAIIFRKIIKFNLKKIVIILICQVIIVLVFNNVSSGRVFSQFSKLNPSTEAEKIENIQLEHPVRFEEVSVADNKFTVKTDSETLIGVANGNSLSFEDEKGNKLGVISEEGNIKFADEKYASYTFQIISSRIKANIYGRRWDLYLNDDKINVISINNKLTVPIEAPRINFFDGKETFASNRGYIWSRTIPLLKETLLVGYGPDSFPMVFPQEDYVGRFNTGSGMLNVVVDKPHNMYMQTAINTGMISLIALIIIWGIYLIDSLKTYLNGNFISFVEYVGAASFLSITAYLVAALFNDSVISVAPLFWVMLGMGIGINRMVKDKLII
ncbi:MAG: O-antigen ligase family protein [Sedimentibacter sp.]